MALTGLAIVTLPAAWRLASPVQQRRAGSRLVFRDVESFDARYLGDTPGHLGREGGLGKDKPDVSLGASVYCGDEEVGEVTRLAWDRSKESREVEFAPKPYRVDSSGRMLEPLRIAVGEEVWVPLGTRAPTQVGR